MSFTDSQLRQLRAPVRPHVVKQRQVEDKVLHYLEGWHVIAEANRIFGFDGWDRETLHSQCVWQKQTGAGYAVAYLTRVRITVHAGERVIQREGLGSGEATALSPGAAHERASKVAETDATKRALSTFGNSFGLSLYRDKAEPPQPRRSRSDKGRKSGPLPDAPSHALPHDVDGTEVPDTPRHLHTRDMVEASLPVWVPAPTSKRDGRDPDATSHVHAPEPPHPFTPSASANTRPIQALSPRRERIEKSALPIGEPKRIRNRDHLRFVAAQPCLVCARTPSQAHHLRFAQPRALGRKVSDEFTVPLCAIHHHELHMSGNERAWWEDKNIEPLDIADAFWRAGQATLAQSDG